MRKRRRLRRATRRMPDAPQGPRRRCLLTGARTMPDRLLRFAVDATGAVVPDPARRMPGRGLWLTPAPGAVATARSEEHTSELQSLMRISYAVLCMKKKNKQDRQ